MKISEIFESIQGEGRYAGFPMLFIRLSGCNRSCSFCDTKYHKESIEMSVEEVCNEIKESELDIVCFTGGEPLLQINDILSIVQYFPNKSFHLETNGDLLEWKSYINIFQYIAISPKSESTCKKIKKNFEFMHPQTKRKIDYKVVTDLKKNKNLIPYATMLMPLTTKNIKKNKQIEQEVWNYCVDNNIKFCLRQHIHVWGINKKGV
jgi:7-carboxy-7-deazaguanine synthase